MIYAICYICSCSRNLTLGNVLQNILCFLPISLLASGPSLWMYYPFGSVWGIFCGFWKLYTPPSSQYWHPLLLYTILYDFSLIPSLPCWISTMKASRPFELAGIILSKYYTFHPYSISKSWRPPSLYGILCEQSRLSFSNLRRAFSVNSIFQVWFRLRNADSLDYFTEHSPLLCKHLPSTSFISTVRSPHHSLPSVGAFREYRTPYISSYPQWLYLLLSRRISMTLSHVSALHPLDFDHDITS